MRLCFGAQPYRAPPSIADRIARHGCVLEFALARLAASAAAGVSSRSKLGHPLLASVEQTHPASLADSGRSRQLGASIDRADAPLATEE